MILLYPEKLDSQAQKQGNIVANHVQIVKWGELTISPPEDYNQANGIPERSAEYGFTE